MRWWRMPNRTISLDEVSDAIRKQLIKDGENFSHWVRMQLRRYQPGESKPEVKPAPPRNYMCKNCFGNHWTADCPSLEASEWICTISFWLIFRSWMRRKKNECCIDLLHVRWRYVAKGTFWIHGGVLQTEGSCCCWNVNDVSTTLLDVWWLSVLVTCAICGFEADVNPRIASIQGHRPHRKMENPPDLWVCDLHFNQDKESNW